MCGIFFHISKSVIKDEDMEKLEEAANTIKHRGPDDTRIRYYNEDCMVCFHRLEITDPTPEGMQPFEIEDWICMINGEIYNYKELQQSMIEDENFDYTPTSGSDCEVVIHKLRHLISKNCRMPAEELVKILDGEFAIVLYHLKKKQLFFFTDGLRVRPLFIGKTGNSITLASEQKALISLYDNIEIVKPELIYSVMFFPINKDHDSEYCNYCNYYNYYCRCCYELYLSTTNCFNTVYKNIQEKTTDIEIAISKLRELLVENVHVKLHPDRPYAFLLSGGLDSSLVCGIAAKYCRDNNLPRIRTFTVGFDKNAPDVVAARLVAKHINSIHEEAIFTYQDGIDLIPEIIRYNESWDQTTTRASVPMGLLVRYIKKNHPEVAVIYSGEVADELLRGYLYNRIPMDENNIREDHFKRLSDISCFDGLRADRVISSQGMELRLPFYSNKLLSFVCNLPYEFLDPSHNNNIEKYILRKAFDGLDYIPNSILWRVKNAFSDATSKMTEGSGSEWKEMLKQEAEKHVTDSRFARRKLLYQYNTPQTKEDMWYRSIFHKYGYHETTIPYKWLPSWIKDATDSSATTLEVFTETKL